MAGHWAALVRGAGWRRYGGACHALAAS